MSIIQIFNNTKIKFYVILTKIKNVQKYLRVHFTTKIGKINIMAYRTPPFNFSLEILFNRIPNLYLFLAVINAK